MAKFSVPLSVLHSSEAQTLKALALIKEMAKVLRDAPVDGASGLIDRAEAFESGVHPLGPSPLQMSETLSQAQQYLVNRHGEDDVMACRICEVLTP